MPEDMPDRMPNKMPDRMPEDMSEYMPEDMPDRMPDRMPDDMSDRMPEDMPDRMPEDLPDRMPEDMPEHMPEDMPDRMPNRMSEDMSDRMPEDLPVRKCINVMVGITRSKVIHSCDFYTKHKPKKTDKKQTMSLHHLLRIPDLVKNKFLASHASQLKSLEGKITAAKTISQALRGVGEANSTPTAGTVESERALVEVGRTVASPDFGSADSVPDTSKRVTMETKTMDDFNASRTLLA